MVFARHQHEPAPALLNPCSHLPPHPIPPGCPRAQALDSLRHTSNLHRLSVLHMVVHMFQLLFSQIIPPSPSPTESKSLFSRWKVKVLLSRVRLWDPMNYTVHGILQARILEWVAFPFSRGIFPTQGSNPGLQHCRRILYQLSHKGSPDVCEGEDFKDEGILSPFEAKGR